MPSIANSLICLPMPVTVFLALRFLQRRPPSFCLSCSSSAGSIPPKELICCEAEATGRDCDWGAKSKARGPGELGREAYGVEPLRK